MDDWKLVVQNGECMLYNLATDLHEDKNIAAENPKIVKKMKKILLREHTHSDIFRVTLPQ